MEGRHRERKIRDTAVSCVSNGSKVERLQGLAVRLRSGVEGDFEMSWLDDQIGCESFRVRKDAPMAYHVGPWFLRKLCEALGIDPFAEPISKVVIECDADDAVKVYIKRLLPTAHGDDVLKWMKEVRDVQVADDCTVKTVEHKSGS